MDNQTQTQDLSSSAFSQTVKSSSLKCGAKTYFFDVKLASNNKRYLRISESRGMGEGKPSLRNTFVLFPEDFDKFHKMLGELGTDLK